MLIRPAERAGGVNLLLPVLWTGRLGVAMFERLRGLTIAALTLIEIVERGRDARAAARVAGRSRMVRTFEQPLTVFRGCGFGRGPGGRG
jgi:hypothetical protein